MPVVALESAVIAHGLPYPENEHAALRLEAAVRAEGATPRMVEGMQVVEGTIGPGSYAPQEIRLQMGTPARLVFTRTTDHACATQIKVPTFGVGPVDLPLGDPVAVEFTPDESGDFTFVCGMDMQTGSLVVRS